MKQKFVSACLLVCIVLLFACKTINKTVAAQQTSVSTSLSIPHYPLNSERDLDILVKEIGDAKIVLLGEASHGTSEYYTWRAALSKRLIQEKGFQCVAVEGDWSETYRINNFIKDERKDSASAIQLLRQNKRWPTWLWANYEVAHFITWLNNFNQSKAVNSKTGFYGLDVFSFIESVDSLLPYLKDTSLVAARKLKACLEPFSGSAMAYQKAVRNAYKDCHIQAEHLWQSVNRQKFLNEATGLYVRGSALAALYGERYFRSGSWNIREQFMSETIKRLVAFYGRNAKIIIWAHNTHVGDAYSTDMPARGRTNLGELLRNEYRPENVYIVGTGSFKGTVIAAQKWDAIMEQMEVAPAREGSLEDLLHQSGAANKIVLSKEIKTLPLFSKWIYHRAIGVVALPRDGLLGAYTSSYIQKRYDAIMYFDETHALHPIQD